MYECVCVCVGATVTSTSNSESGQQCTQRPGKMRDYRPTYRSHSRLVSKSQKTVKKGEVILTSEPFAHVINFEYSSMYCNHCLGSHKTKMIHMCQGCRKNWYCSDECERLSWPIHRYECDNLKRLDPYTPPDFVRLMARVILRLRDGGDKIVEKYSQREGRRFRDLMNHYADVKNNEERKQDADYLLGELKKYIGEDFLPNYSDFLGIYGRMLVNRFCLLDKTMMNIGSAMYLSASIFDHACKPNCYISFDGKNVQIRALVDMPNFSYSKCRISYTDPVCSVTSRRENLYKKWFFWCDCSFCHDEGRVKFENTIKCENVNCQAPVTVPEMSRWKRAAWQQKATTNGEQQKETTKDEQQKTWGNEIQRKPSTEEKQRDKQQQNGKQQRDNQRQEEEEEEPPACSVCNCPVSDLAIRQYQLAVTFTKEKLSTMSEENPTLESCLEILEKQDNFSSMNVWRVRTTDFAFNACVYNGCWIRALTYGEENLCGMRYYYGSEHPTLGLFLFKLGKAKIYFKEFRDGIRCLEEAEPHVVNGLGPNHPIVEDLRLTSLMANEDIEICLERRIAAANKRQMEITAKENNVFNYKRELEKIFKYTSPVA
ncbi:histone-lysine N-methyltransferase ASHR1-like isoform X2 [Homarus americanus]|uniref:Histone-lysine N-methyltransferase SMYD3-like 3 n=1 Tax=Homarus americanus TaxID=6706 RepID=A0A8J5JIZ9_HOMAM|nr:histone-lysine N-methyltransferase ASHR1-like isoform X2 [Homarus americanus]KAG7158937.1 histone-lysine N-methyltransferase SMYD3-like 3 [Homarus americanus]